MLGSALPATATLQTSTPNATPSSPTRTSRLRGLSYLRNYTHNHLHSSSSRENTPSLPRSRSSNALTTSNSRGEEGSRRGQNQQPSQLEGAENGWLPTVQGRTGQSSGSLNPASTTESASPERHTSMSRNRASSGALGTTSLGAATMRRPSRTMTTQLPPMPSLDAPTPSGANTPANQQAPDKSGTESDMPTIRFIPHMDRSHQRPSLNFQAVTRTLASATSIVRVGRYSERDQTNHSAQFHDGPNAVAPVGFKSKVVSRKHCEFWQSNGQWYVKDVKSSSGTFLNHVRLSGPGQESRPFPVSDGDLVQLGIDFKGGEEVIFRCVKIRVEINRGWQKNLNAFNTSEYKKIVNRTKAPKKGAKREADAASTNSSECSICLNPVAPCQALFVAPCSHVWHFKCIRNLINGLNFPNFLCPNCRFSADLEADVEPPEDYEDEDDFEDIAKEIDGDDDLVVDEEDERGDSGGGVGIGDGSEEDAAPGSPNQRARDGFEERPVELPQVSSQQASKPRMIRPQQVASPSPDPVGARSTTPTSNTQFALAAGVISMDGANDADDDDGVDGALSDMERATRQDTVGPMTPRNDAGPFVLDGAGEGAADASRALQREVSGDERR